MNRKQLDAAIASGEEVALYVRGYMGREVLGSRRENEMERVTIVEVTKDGEPIESGKSIQTRREARRRTVKYRHPETGEKRYTEPRFVLSSWAEYRTARAAYLAAKRASHERQKATDAKRETDATEALEILSRLGFTDMNGIQVVKAPHVKATFTVDALKRLIAAVEERAGREPDPFLSTLAAQSATEGEKP